MLPYLIDLVLRQDKPGKGECLWAETLTDSLRSGMIGQRRETLPLRLRQKGTFVITNP